MITIEQFKKLKEQFGAYASFTIWESWENVGDIAMFEDENIYKKLNNKYVFVALNPSEQLPGDKVEAFKNFHSDYSYQKDFKLCYALEGTEYWGSYITDLFKSIRVTNSAELNRLTKERPEDVERDKKLFLQELDILDNKDIVLIALSRKSETCLRKIVGNQYTIIYCPHYSTWGSHEKYREKLINILK